MVVPSIWVPLPKTQENWPNAKKGSFLHFFVSLCKKNSNGRQSDNFGPRRSAYGPSESLCPKFSKTHLRKVSVFKIVGATPLQSQVIQICVRQKCCFFGTFLEKILFWSTSAKYTPTHDIHQRKAVHVSVPHVPQPAGHQNFANSWRQKLAHVLRPRRNKSEVSRQKLLTHGNLSAKQELFVLVTFSQKCDKTKAKHNSKLFFNTGW